MQEVQRVTGADAVHLALPTKSPDLLRVFGTEPHVRGDAMHINLADTLLASAIKYATVLSGAPGAANPFQVNPSQPTVSTSRVVFDPRLEDTQTGPRVPCSSPALLLSARLSDVPQVDVGNENAILRSEAASMLYVPLIGSNSKGPWAAAVRLSWASPRRFASPLQHDQVILAVTVLADMAVHVLNAHRDLVTD